MREELKKIFLLSFIFLMTGCSVGVVGPYTGTSYMMGIEKEKGIYLQAKPPGWDMAAEFGDKIIQTISSEEEENSK